VVLRPVPDGGEPDRLAAAPEHPRLLVPRRVADAGGTCLVTPRLAGGGLDAVLARRGRLTAGQVGTVVADVAEALTALHETGTVHGRVRPDAVVLDGEGRAVLDGAALLLPGGQGGPDDDVLALVDLARTCLGEAADRPSAALHRLLATVAAGAVPTARELAAQVAAVARPEPVRPGPARRPQVAGPEHRRSGSRPMLRRVGAVLAAGAVLVLAVAAGAWWADRARTESTTALAAASPVVPDDWETVVATLDARRSAAFGAADPALLATAVESGSPAAQTDGAALRSLAAQDLHVVGLATDVLSLAPISTGEDSATLRVVDTRSRYRVVAADGAVVTEVPARDRGAWRVELRRGDDGRWRFYRVTGE
jgi:hypothetical protein